MTDAAEVVLPDGTVSDVMKEATLVSTGNSAMNDAEAALAVDFYEAIQTMSRTSVRSQQAGRFQIGISDLGFCPERTRRMLGGQRPDDTDVLPAWIGTALGDHAEQAWKARHPEAIIQAEVTVEFILEIDGRRFSVSIPGHPDIVMREGILIDVKTDYGLADSEKLGPSRQQQYQRHCYGKAAFDAGLFDPGVTLDSVRVANVWIDRSGQDRAVHVDMETLDLGVVEEARDWLEDVIYHQVRGEAAQKVPPRDMCYVVCGFAADCRGFDTDVEGLIEDPETLTRIAMYVQGRDLEREGRRLKEQAKVHLKGVRGVTGTHLVRSTDVGEAYVPGYTRKGYTTVDIRPLPKGRKR